MYDGNQAAVWEARRQCGVSRVAEIGRLIEKVFEQNASGVLSDERFAKMLQNYEAEQKRLTQEAAENRQILQNAEQQVVDFKAGTPYPS